MAAHDRALIPLGRNGRTFRETAQSYLEHGGSPRYLDRIIAHFDETPVSDITPFDVRQMADLLYPHAANSTKNRCALSPTRAVLIHGYERGWCALMRLRSFKIEAPKRKSPASPAWLQIFVRQCDHDGLPHLGALVLFMATTGARISEAVRLEWPQVDLANRRATLLKTKTGTNSRRSLSDELIRRMQLLAADADRYPNVFRYRSRYSVNERIAAVCDRAGLVYKSPHLCGRHSFATISLQLGSSIKETMEAGDWKSSEIFIETYVHAGDASRKVADRFNSIDFNVDV